MTRLPNWKKRLTAYLAEVVDRPFKPGQHDCALFVAGAVQAMTGDDLAKGWRGYRSLTAGRRALAKRGYSDQVALAASMLPRSPRPWRRRATWQWSQATMVLPSVLCRAKWCLCCGVRGWQSCRVSQ